MTDPPLRILHVLGAMNRGGVETWLMHLLRHIDRERYHMDFLVHSEAAAAFDEEIRALGSRVIPCLHPHQPLRYAHNFRRILREYGPYDVVHSHVHHFSGYVLWLATQSGLPVRIAHSHSDTASRQQGAAATRALYYRLMAMMIERFSTLRLAASEQAARALFKPGPGSAADWRILHYGIDPAPFQHAPDPAVLRASLGIPAAAQVCGHVGSFLPVKNHRFLLETMAELNRVQPDFYLLLVGDGPLRPELEARIAELGLGHLVIMTGLRSDVPQLLMGAVDLFLMPSLYEGLPVALLEAQAAGLPCVVSDRITTEAHVIEGLVTALPLEQPPAAWATAVLARLRDTRPLPDAVEQLARAGFTIHSNVDTLAAIYRGQD